MLEKECILRYELMQELPKGSIKSKQLEDRYERQKKI